MDNELTISKRTSDIIGFMKSADELLNNVLKTADTWNYSERVTDSFEHTFSLMRNELEKLLIQSVNENLDTIAKEGSVI